MLRIKALEAYYGNIRVLKEVSMEVNEGEIVCIIGANGAGKSTLLKSISGLLRTKRASIEFLGKDISYLEPGKLVAHGISHVLEGRQLFAHLTVKENLLLGAFHYYKHKNKQRIREQEEEIYSLFPVLQTRATQLAGTLSGGEQQMLAIGRALMANPKLLLLDEPSMGLAPLIVKDIFDIIQRLNEKGTTILLVEQNAKLALGIANFAYVFETGNIVLKGEGKKLLHNPKVKEAYLGA